jgi:ABC superfamily ATP binding cassette transporter ABC protein
MLSFENFSLSYGDNTPVLQDISLTIKEGECLLLTGESGSGKSSLIHAVNGLAYQYYNGKSKGKLHFQGEDLSSLPIYKIALRIATVFQNPKTHFFNINTTRELLFTMENMGLDRAEIDRRMEALLSIFPIEKLLGRNIFALSGGEKQILALASAYLSGCPFLVLDEPSSNLDEGSICVLKTMLRILKEKGITILVAEHRLYYLMDIMDRVAFLEKGRLRNLFSREDFLALPEESIKTMGLRSRTKPSLSLPEWKNEGALRYDKEEHCTSFSLGKIYGIVGENGIGKSTFLRKLSGLEKEKGSHFSLYEKELSQKQRLALSAMVMQDVNQQLFGDSVEEEMELGKTGQKRGLKEIVERIIDQQENEQENEQNKPKPHTMTKEELLSALGLSELKDRHPMSLSGGQKQRLALAATLYQEAKLFFFDEPTSGMDQKNMLRIAALLKSAIREDRIFFIVSHDYAFLQEVADEVVEICLLNLDGFQSVPNLLNR